MSPDREVVVVAGARTPFVKAWTHLNRVGAVELGRVAMREALERAEIDPESIDEVIVGNIAGPADAANVARVIALESKIPRKVPAFTVSRNCASGLESVVEAAYRIRQGDADLVVAGAVESMSRIPMLFSDEAHDLWMSVARARGRGVLLVLAAVYRSPWPVALSALPAASGVLAGIAAVSLIFGPVHGITLAFGAILVGEAVDYPTYLYAHAAPGEPLARTAARIGPPLGLAILTTACGALAMLLSSFRGLAQLGTLLIVGIAVSGLVVWRCCPCSHPRKAWSASAPASPLRRSRCRACARSDPGSPLRQRSPPRW